MRTIREIQTLKVEPERVVGDGSKKVSPDHVECPFCSRKFGKAARDRHISWCKEQKSRSIRSPKVNKNLSANNVNRGEWNRNGITNSSNHVFHSVRNNTLSRVKTRWKLEEGPSNNQQEKPAMKFKEKFPNHIRSSLDSIMTQFLANTENPQEILKKPETVTGPMIPKTVPGVRTRGLTFMKGNTGQFEMTSQGSAGESSLNDTMPKLFNRPIQRDLHNGQVNDLRNSGSLGSNSSRPSIDLSSEPILSRFCHQCGSKYSTQSAKYCHECGLRRLNVSEPFSVR